MTETMARPPLVVYPPSERRSWAINFVCIFTGAAMALAGWILTGSSWIRPNGLLAGGVALVACGLFARTILDPLLVTTPFMFYTLSPVGGILTVGSADILVPGIILLLLVRKLVRRGTREAHRYLRGADVLLILSGLVITGSTTLWTALDPTFLANRAVADAIKLVTGVVYLIITFILIRDSGLAAALRALRLWGWTATLLSLGSLAGVTGAITIIPSDGYRSLGYFEDANLYAGYLLVSLSVVLFLSTVAPSWLYPLQSLVIFGGLVMTGSRGGMLSLALLVLFISVMINSARLRLMLISVTLAGSWLSAWLLFYREPRVHVLGLDRLFFASQKASDDPRTALWGRAIEKWLDAPVWGIGLGQFERFSGDAFRRLKTTGLGYVTHNSFLFFLVAFGIIGLALFLALFLWMLWHLYRATELSRQAKHALASGLLMIASQMMTLNLQNLRYVWIYFGVVLGIAFLSRQQSLDRPRDAATAETGGTR